MLTIHDEADTAIRKGWGYFGEWRKSRNFLLLLDALLKVDHAERAWLAFHGPKGPPMRREWQVLRRCVARAILRVRSPLLEATAPDATEKALYRGKKRARLARTDQLESLAVTTALLGSGSESVDFERAGSILAEWGVARAQTYLTKRASELGLTKRRTHAARPVRSTWPRRSGNTEVLGHGRIRHIGRAY